MLSPINCDYSGSFKHIMITSILGILAVVISFATLELAERPLSFPRPRDIGGRAVGTEKFSWACLKFINVTDTTTSKTLI